MGLCARPCPLSLHYAGYIHVREDGALRPHVAASLTQVLPALGASPRSMHLLRWQGRCEFLKDVNTMCSTMPKRTLRRQVPKQTGSLLCLAVVCWLVRPPAR